MSNPDFYIKYMKYKNKYMNLKQNIQHGGDLGANRAQSPPIILSNSNSQPQKLPTGLNIGDAVGMLSIMNKADVSENNAQSILKEFEIPGKWQRYFRYFPEITESYLQNTDINTVKTENRDKLLPHTFILFRKKLVDYKDDKKEEAIKILSQIDNYLNEVRNRNVQLKSDIATSKLRTPKDLAIQLHNNENKRLYVHLLENIDKSLNSVVISELHHPFTQLRFAWQ